MFALALAIIGLFSIFVIAGIWSEVFCKAEQSRIYLGASSTLLFLITGGMLFVQGMDTSYSESLQKDSQKSHSGKVTSCYRIIS